MIDKIECCKKCTFKLCPLSLGIALGIAKALFVMLFVWYAWLSGHVTMFTEIGFGITPTFAGGLIGGAWGFLCGLIFGFIVGLIYDFCVDRCKCCKWKRSVDSEK